ncbi:uncharacterized protein EDB93DRAFT_1243504 [Suillus bovinus]|uniref:uncharacterized protein n=1 Tax=Suillus bovinus TaxID=48563 RepID=UPI001B871452|nr:uncharacterized protein EDB93DRAFT_1243504 [Suillus bovinus]KAG2128950.1 hypothetical protein EDB93DRAFT_1243504 [Suillus bovinus]
MSSSLGLHIVDPKFLSDQVEDVPSILPPISLTAPPSRHKPAMSSISQDNLYSNLATFTFGEARSISSGDESPDAISPLTPITRTGANRTPRPSVSTFTSHPSQGLGRPASNAFPSSLRSSRSHRTEHTDEESSEDPSSPDLHPRHGFQRGRLIPDNVSQHTFGQPAVRYSTASITSSRSSSRVSLRSDLQFSSDEEVEIASYNGGSSPVTFARDLDNIDENENSPVFHPRPLFSERRRGSLPMAIPGAISDAVSNRSREDSILTIRRPSRSLDDDFMPSHTEEDPAAVAPRSEPLTRADFRSLEAQAQQQQSESDTWASGWDLSYVLSRKSEGSIHSVRSTAQLSFLAPARNSTSTGEPSSSRLSNIWNGSGRRTSTGTLQTTNSGEDTFAKHIGMYDTQNQWAFWKEKADAQPVPNVRRPNAQAGAPVIMDKTKRTMYPGTQEIWRSGHVGRFRVDRLVFKPSTADPAKAAQQRINIRHIPDPFLKGPKTSGPSTVIHKHSRATAFSIFRSYSLFTSKRAGTGSRNIHMHTSGGIMLAPKKVQEQYTSTRTTSKLITHGLLEDRSRKAIGNGSDKSRRATFLEKEKRREKEKEDAKKAKAKGKEKKKESKKNNDRDRASNPTESTESSATTSSTGSISASHVMSAPARATSSKITFASSIVSPRSPVKAQSTSGPSSPETSSTFDHSFKKLLSSDSSTSVATSHIRSHRDSIDSDEHLPTRTPHAEAFGTLDPNDIEHLRRAQKPTDGNSSFANRIFRRFRGAANRVDNITQPVATTQNAYSPPWIVTAGRDQNEEHVRVLTDLNNSFRDVGLLHTQPSHRTGKGGGAKKRAVTHDVFDYVPEDSLYMLLPLWAGETDPGAGGGVGSGSIMAGSSSISEDSTTSTTATAATTATSATLTIPEDRQFLLVWYVPFEDKNKNTSSSNSNSNSASSSVNKKKLKQTNSTSDTDAESNQKNIYLRNFRVNARLVGYDELRGTGIRVPSDGLAVGGPALDAGGPGGVRNREEPESQPGLASQSGTGTALGIETVICMCSSRENGFHFQPEGLCKLGLCLQEEVVLPAANNPRAIYLEIPTSEMKHLLTPVGRAAVEMVWLGCLAITSFGPY